MVSGFRVWRFLAEFPVAFDIWFERVYINALGRLSSPVPSSAEHGKVRCTLCKSLHWVVEHASFSCAPPYPIRALQGIRIGDTMLITR